MRKKKSATPVFEHYSLPSENDKLKQFIGSKKVDMMEQAVSSIEYALHHQLPFVEVFQFSGSDFVITISEKDFLGNLNHIYNYYIENEMYEYCGRVMELKKRLSIILKLNETKS